VPISLLPELAQTLGTTMEALIGTPEPRTTGKRAPAPKLLHQLEQVSRLPKALRKFVSQMLDTVLQQAGR
jgi:hypothetical protein